ncbi:MAG: DUF2029 domain-containing protein [Chloroflexota bacterium]|nr:DUF2029 domain-containing protein [Chloroflexota bacterium]
MTHRLSPVTVALAVTAGLAVAATLAILGTVVAHVTTHASVSDFLAYYTAGYLVRTGQGVHLYQPALIESTERLLYHGRIDQPAGYPLPLFAAWLFAPLSKLSFTTAYCLYMFMSTALLAGLLWALNRQLADVPRGERRLFMVCAALALPSLATIVFGQVDLIALSGLLAGYLLLRSERRVPAGFALCLVLIKPQLLVGVALFLVVKRDWRTIGALAALGVPLLIVPALLTGPATLLGNVREIAQHDSRGLAAAHLGVMANWRGFIVSVTGSDKLLYWAPGFVAIAVAATALGISRWRSTDGTMAFDRGYSLAVLLPLLVSPHVHTQNLIVGVLPAALFLRAYLGPTAPPGLRRRAANATLLILSLLFVLPFLAIQGLSLTVFLCVGCYVAVSFHWPDADGISEQRASVGDRRVLAGEPGLPGAGHHLPGAYPDEAA